MCGFNIMLICITTKFTNIASGSLFENDNPPCLGSLFENDNPPCLGLLLEDEGLGVLFWKEIDISPLIIGLHRKENITRTLILSVPFA